MTDALFDLPEYAPIGDVSRYDRATVIDAAFTHYRHTGFPELTLNRHQAMQHINALAGSETEPLIGSMFGYHIPDRYQRHRFSTPVETKPTVVAQFMRDDTLRHALGMCLDAGRISDVMLVAKLAICRGAQLPAQFRPGFALHLLRRYCPDGGRVFDPSAGYGGRLVGFLASECSAYTGIDPNVPTHEGNLQMVADLAPADKEVSLICLPAEDVEPAAHAGTADFAFSSPPYFGKERYSEDATQSWVRYSTPDTWRTGFLEPYLRLTAAALKRSAVAAINVADVVVARQIVPLVRWTIDAGIAAGLEHTGTELFPMARATTAEVAEPMARYESVVIFTKPATA